MNNSPPNYFDYNAAKQGLPSNPQTPDVIEFEDVTTQVREVAESDRDKFMQAYLQALTPVTDEGKQ